MKTSSNFTAAAAAAVFAAAAPYVAAALAGATAWAIVMPLLIAAAPACGPDGGR